MNNTPTQQINTNIPSKYAALINTGKAIDQVISKDQEHPDLVNALNAPTSSVYAAPLISSKREFSEIGKVNIPAHLFDRIASIQCRTFSGIFPEISRAWLTIDNTLYLWDYNNPMAEIFEYADQDQIILSAALIKSRPGLFNETVKYLIVVATPLQVIFIAVIKPNHLPSVSHSTPDHRRVEYMATRTVVSTDDVKIRSITGTDDGRIFVVSHDGRLHEIILTSDSAYWLRSDYMLCRTQSFYEKLVPALAQPLIGLDRHPRVKSIAVDNERQVLYLLCEKSVIEVVYLGDATDNYKPIFMHKNIVENAMQICRQQVRSATERDFQIESIHVISKKESKRIHLMAITITGYRLYFTHYQDGFRTMMNVVERPSTLELGHIRMPPLERLDVTQMAPTFSKSYYDCGICVSVKAKDDMSDSLQITSVGFGKLPAPKQPQSSSSAIRMTTSIPTVVNNVNYFETRALLHLNEKVWTIVELNKDLFGNHPIKEISQQFSDPPRQFGVLTTQSITFYKKERPVDILHHLVQQLADKSNDYLKYTQSFVERYGQAESCAMCLSIICDSTDQKVEEQATDLYFRFGGDPSSTHSSQVLGNFLARVAGEEDVIYSGKRDGLLLYFARIVAPVWKLALFPAENSPATDTQIQVRLNIAKENLLKLKSFMEKNSHIYISPHITDPRFQATDNRSLTLKLAEQKSMHSIYTLLVQSIEAISFIGFVVETTHYIGIEKYLGSDVQKDKIHDLHLCSVLTTMEGRELVHELTIGTIARFGTGYNHAGCHVVSQELETRCKNFFGSSDICFFKGLEYLYAVEQGESDPEKEYALKESLVWFKKAADEITKLKSICSQYMRYSFHIGIIELVLERARRLDPNNQGLLAFKSPEMRDENNLALMYARFEAYDCILNALLDMFSFRTNSVPADRKPIDDPHTYVTNVVSVALSSDDELFHYRLYRWFREMGCMDELLSVDTKYLLYYLHNYEDDQKVKYSFLFQYYKNREDFFRAAKYSEALADLPGVPMNDRIAHLANALIAARCAEKQVQDYHHDYLRHLNHRIVWAQIQGRMRDIIYSQGGQGAAEAVEHLNQHLLSPEELQENFRHVPQITQLLEEVALRNGQT